MCFFRYLSGQIVLSILERTEKTITDSFTAFLNFYSLCVVLASIVGLLLSPLSKKMPVGDQLIAFPCINEHRGQ